MPRREYHNKGFVFEDMIHALPQDFAFIPTPEITNISLVMEPLDEKELKILIWRINGCTREEAAAACQISTSTLKHYQKNALAKVVNFDSKDDELTDIMPGSERIDFDQIGALLIKNGYFTKRLSASQPAPKI